MRVEGSQDNREAFRVRGPEETGTDPAYEAIRASLRTLPQAPVPTGFESRLQRRIDGLESRRLGRAWEYWTFTRGWLSAGVGVTTAVVVGLLFFQPRQPELPSSAFTEEMQPASPSVLSPFPVTSSARALGEVERSFTGSPERETDLDLLAGEERTDSLGHSFHPPSGHFQVVGEGHPAPGR